MDGKRLAEPYLPCGCRCPVCGGAHVATCTRGHVRCALCLGPAWAERRTYQRELAVLARAARHWPPTGPRADDSH